MLQSYREDFRLNFKLALPIMLGQLGQVSVNIADNLMVGRLGATALAAVSMSVAVLMVTMVVGMGISFALPPLVSEADGAKKLKQIPIFFKHSFVLNLMYALLTLGLILLIVPQLRHFGQDPEAVVLAKPYLVISAWSMIPFMVFQTLRCYSDGLSNTVIPMTAIVIGNVLNIFLNYLLIFGKFGMPEMGVAGAATASLIARIVMILVIVILLLRKSRLAVHLKRSLQGRFQLSVFKRILDLGVPTSLQMFFEVSAFAGAALLMGMVGKNEQAAHQITINLASTTFLIATGLGMAATIRVGNRLGEQNYPALRRAGLSAIVQVILFMLVCAIIFVFARFFFPTLYIDDPVVLKIASYLLLFAALFQIPDGIQVVVLGALRGFQDVRIPTLITFIAYWIFGLPFSYFSTFHWGFGPGGIWLGLVVGLTISASLLTYRFWKKSSRLEG